MFSTSDASFPISSRAISLNDSNSAISCPNSSFVTMLLRDFLRSLAPPM